MRELRNLPGAGGDQAQDRVLSKIKHGLMVQCSLRLWATFKELVFRNWRAHPDNLFSSWLASFFTELGFLWVSLASPELGELVEVLFNFSVSGSCAWRPHPVSFPFPTGRLGETGFSLLVRDLRSQSLPGDLSYSLLVTAFSAGIRWPYGSFQGVCLISGFLSTWVHYAAGHPVWSSGSDSVIAELGHRE